MRQKTGYRVVGGSIEPLTDPAVRRELADFLARDGQLLLPPLELVDRTEFALDEMIDVAGRAAIESVLELSAREVAGPKRPGWRADLGSHSPQDAQPSPDAEPPEHSNGTVRWHGRQNGVVALSDRKLRVSRPRLRCEPDSDGSGAAEVEIPAYASMQAGGRLAQRMAEILMRGVSTSAYGKVVTQLADTVGVSKSSVSREFVEASADGLRTVCERRFDDKDLCWCSISTGWSSAAST